MISLALLLLALAPQKPPPASIDGLPIGALPRQSLPKTGCAAYLWSTSGSQALVAMATADPAQLRLSIGGTVTDLARSAQREPGGFGFAGVTDYAAPGVNAVLTMTTATRADLKDGGAVPQATLQLERPGQDSIVVPLAGLVGCV